MCLTTLARAAVLICTGALLATPLLALGAQAAPAVQQAEPRKEKPKRFTGDVGFVKTGGNTDLTTLNVSERIAFERGGWGLEQYFATVYGKEDGDVTTSLWRAGLKGERFIGTKLSAVLGTAWDRNRFAGIDGRFEEFLGLKYRWLASATNTLYTELAAALVQQDNTDATRDDFPAARLGAGWRRNFSEKAYFQDVFEYIPNLDESTDYRINNEAAIVAPLSSFVALKFSYVIRFDNLPPPTFEKTDTFLTSGLQVSF